MLKRFFIITGSLIAFNILCSSEILADVDITLNDNVSNSTLDIIIDSNGSDLPGVDIDVNFSRNLTIKEIHNPSNYCTLGFNTLASNGVISIECLNNSSIEMVDTFTTIEYDTKSDEYYFYINQDTLDIGDNDLGNIVDVNRPEKVTDELDIEDEKNVNTPSKNIPERLVEIIKNNYLLISGIIIIISIALILLLFKKKF